MIVAVDASACFEDPLLKLNRSVELSLLHEWLAAENHDAEERRSRSVFLESRSYTQFGRLAGMDWRRARRAYARLRRSFCEHLEIAESLFDKYAHGGGDDRAA